MSLQEQVKEDMKTAMKAKEAEKLMTIRGVMAAMTNKLVELGRMPQDALSDEEVLAVIKTEVKRRKDSIQQFRDAGREDLANAETLELAYIEPYLPELMSMEQVREIVLKKKEELGVSDKSGMGKLVGAIMADLKGAADGTMVKEAVEALFT
jgi:uncharacterized protein YqeY